MKLSEHGFMIPEYTDIAAIPALMEYNAGVLERIIAEGGAGGGMDGEILLDGGEISSADGGSVYDGGDI